GTVPSAPLENADAAPPVAPADAAPLEAHATPPEAAAVGVPLIQRPPPAGRPSDFPFLSPALEAGGGTTTAELEAVASAAAMGRRRRVWPWTLLLALVAVGGASAAWFMVQQQPPSTGRVVLDVSPPEARGRVRLTVDGADLGVPTHWPVVQSVRSGKVEI